jgi:hypothetical protein
MLHAELLLHCLAAAMMDRAQKALLGQSRFGDVLYSVAADFTIRLRDGRSDADVRAGLGAAAAADPEEWRDRVDSIVEQVIEGKTPRLGPPLAHYLLQLPSCLRQSLRRPGDPDGVVIPPKLLVSTTEDLLPFVPARVPRGRPGMRLQPPLYGWELTELLGIGLFGEVWCAVHDDKDAPPAVVKLCTDPAAGELLTRKLADKPSHSEPPTPGVVSLLAVGPTLHPPCVIYDYIPGGDLAALVHDLRPAPGPARVAMVTRLIQRTAAILGGLHRRSPPVVHGGLTPRSILLQPSPSGAFHVRIAELGVGLLATLRAYDNQRFDKISQGEVLAATLRGGYGPLYASPERLRSEPLKPTDDVHALGVVWFQLIVGDLSAQPSGVDWMNEARQAGLDGDLLRLLAAAVSVRTDRRPVDAAQFAEELTPLIPK